MNMNTNSKFVCRWGSAAPSAAGIPQWLLNCLSRAQVRAWRWHEQHYARTGATQELAALLGYAQRSESSHGKVAPDTPRHCGIQRIESDICHGKTPGPIRLPLADATPSGRTDYATGCMQRLFSLTIKAEHVVVTGTLQAARFSCSHVRLLSSVSLRLHV